MPKRVVRVERFKESSELVSDAAAAGFGRLLAPENCGYKRLGQCAQYDGTDLIINRRLEVRNTQIGRWMSKRGTYV